MQEPNAVTQETLEKSERGEDVKSFDTVEELFADLDKPDEEDIEDIVDINEEVRKRFENLDDMELDTRFKQDEDDNHHLY